jgi:uncharacterized membrane protein
MKPETTQDRMSNSPAGGLPDSVGRNIEAVAGFYEAEERKISGPQDFIEKTSSFAGRPGYLAFLVVFIALWMIVNLLASWLGWMQFDAPPFFWLQGIVSLYALLISTAVLIRQERAAKLAEQRAHLDLQVNLLTESKVAKVIELMEELRRDLPNVADRHDPEVASMQTPASPHAVLSALETHAADKKA